LSFSDVETGQAHDVNAVGNTPGPLGTLGMLFASIERDTDGSLRVTGDPDGFLAASPSDGVLKWDYHVNEDRIQMLGQNESHTDFFDVMLTDHNGGFTTQKVAVLVQGANDVPVLQGDGEHSLYFDGSFTDAPNPLVTVGLQQVNGFGFIDPDQNDHHTVSAHLNLSKSTVDVAASLTVELIKDTHEFGPFDTNGQIRWIYQRDVNTTAYLPGHGGEPRIQTWDVTIDDGHGGAIIPFVVTFNSAPVIQNNAPTEMILDEIPSESIRDLHGILIFSDADPTDHHTVTVSSDSALMHGTQPVGTLTASLEPNFNITSNLVHWDYYVSEAAIEHLHAGEQLVDAFDVQVDDGHGGIAQHLVKVTILGNDFDLVWQT
jgi:VCBS repeat-containing protein